MEYVSAVAAFALSYFMPRLSYNFYIWIGRACWTSLHLIDCHLYAEVLKWFKKFLALARFVAYCGINILLLAWVSVFFEDLLSYITKVHHEVLEIPLYSLTQEV